MTNAEEFTEYYNEKVSTLGVGRTLKQAALLFIDSIDYKKSGVGIPATVYILSFNDDSFVKYNFKEGIIN